MSRGCCSKEQQGIQKELAASRSPLSSLVKISGHCGGDKWAEARTPRLRYLAQAFELYLNARRVVEKEGYD